MRQTTQQQTMQLMIQQTQKNKIKETKAFVNRTGLLFVLDRGTLKYNKMEYIVEMKYETENMIIV